MRDKLAERLLADVMNWEDKDVARERPDLEALAALKYDEYQQFSPGMRFIESLARWLRQFKSEERECAYKFVRSRLIFLSEAEMSHFASIAYPDHIRRYLLKRAAEQDKISPYLVGKVSSSPGFQRLQRNTLFLGLSDGARIDQFRRSNQELSHEQILPSYQVQKDRISEIRAWRKEQGLDDRPIAAIVLLDDFAGSGTSCFRDNDAGYQDSVGDPNGKLVRFVKSVANSDSEWGSLISFPETAIVISHYVATAQAVSQIDEGGKWLNQEFGAELETIVVQLLDERIRLSKSTEDDFVDLIENYYDAAIEDKHTKKGRRDLKYGYAGCGLPLVLHHNTPNNSISLLWAEQGTEGKPLFPRINRHKDS